MGSFLYKPIGQGQIGGGRATFLLEDTGFVSGGWYDDSGNLVERFNRAQGTPEPGQKAGVKFYAKQPGGAYGENLTARFTDSSGQVHEYKIANGGQRYEGDLGNPGSLKAVNKGPMGGGAGSSGIPAGMTPGQIGENGFFPADLIERFPEAVLGIFEKIKAANFNFTDPLEFAKKFGQFNRNEIETNFGQAQDMALKELNTELKGLEQFAPAAAALKRQQTSIDNLFNQQQRTQQVRTALPGVEGQLNRQGIRAETYAEGRVPDSITDRALELGIRSNAADQGYVGGFGAGSSANQKTSNLMSADARIKLSQYGDQLLGQNILQKSNTFLAPTEYSDAGNQIRVSPEVGGARLTQESLSQINPLTILPPGQALDSTVQQNQFQTNLDQRTNEFNASNSMAASFQNAAIQNQFAMDKFGYQVGLATSVASAAQTNANTNLQIQMQQQYLQVMLMMQQQAQQMQQINDIFKGGLGILTNAGGIVDSITHAADSIKKC